MTLICGCTLTPATPTTPEVFEPCHQHALPAIQPRRQERLSDELPGPAVPCVVDTFRPERQCAIRRRVKNNVEANGSRRSLHRLGAKDADATGNHAHVQNSLDRLLAVHKNSDGTPFHVSFSGGKDSIVTLDLVRRSEIPHTAHMGLTGVDPPELLRFVRTNYPDVVLHRPKMTMFQLIAHKGIPPRKNVRYCCAHLKEYLGEGLIVTTGIRWEESAARRRRSAVEVGGAKKTTLFIHPIIDWSAAQVWAYIADRKLETPNLYREGYSRIGCILCPMMTQKSKAGDMKRFPKFVKAYRAAFVKMIATRRRKELPCDRNFTDADTAFEWWISRSKSWDQAELPFTAGRWSMGTSG